MFKVLTTLLVWLALTVTSLAQSAPSSLTLSGNTAGLAPTPTTGNEGNFFLDYSSGKLFQKNSGTWALAGTLPSSNSPTAGAGITTGLSCSGGTSTTICLGDANLTYSTGSLSLGLAGSVVGQLALSNATSGSITLAPPTGALGTVTATLPANTGTIAELNLAQSWTGLQTFNSAISSSIIRATSLNNVNNTNTVFTLTNSVAQATTAGLIMTAAAPTVSAAQIGIGGTTAAAANCNVTSPTPVACVVINVAGTIHYIPYY